MMELVKVSALKTEQFVKTITLSSESTKLKSTRSLTMMAKATSELQ